MMEEAIETWAKANGHNVEECARGMHEAVRRVSTMQAGKISFLPITSPNSIGPDQNGHVDGPGGESEAYLASFLLTFALFVLNAASECPRLLFMLIISEGDGACFYNTVCSLWGGDPRELRRRVFRSLVKDWKKPCPYPGHTGCTYKQVLEDEFKQLFPTTRSFYNRVWKPNEKGELPDSRPLELWRTAELKRKKLCILSRNGNDGELVPEQVVYPMDAQAEGDPGFLMNGMNGQGGSHYNRLLLAHDGASNDALDLVGKHNKAFESTESLPISEAFWNSKALVAKGEALSVIVQLGATHIAENLMGGNERLMAQVRNMLRECAAQHEGLGDKESRTKAGDILAGSVSDMGIAAALLSEPAVIEDELARILASSSEQILTTLTGRVTAVGGEENVEEYESDDLEFALALSESQKAAHDKEAMEVAEAVGIVRALEEDDVMAEDHKVLVVVSVIEALDDAAAVSEPEGVVTR